MKDHLPEYFAEFFCVNNQRFAMKTPYLAGALVAFLVFVEAPISGTSLNPARSFAPSLLASVFTDQWLYWIAPPVGAVLAVMLFGRLFAKKDQGGCAKLFHTERYRCIFLDCAYQVVKAGTVVIRARDRGASRGNAPAVEAALRTSACGRPHAGGVARLARMRPAPR